MRKNALRKTAMILTLALGMSLTACGSKDEATSSSNTESGTQAVTQGATEAAKEGEDEEECGEIDGHVPRTAA